MNKKFWIVGLALIAAVICAVVFFFVPNNKYNQAQSLLTEHRYEEALKLYQELGSYKDARHMAEGGLQFKYAEYLLEKEEYEAASAQFAAAAEYNYADAAQRRYEPYYLLGEKLLQEGRYEEAVLAFANAKNYKDAKERIGDPYYQEAEKLLKEELYDKAAESFVKAGAVDRVGEPYYLQAEQLLREGDYESASKAFAQAGAYQDARAQILEPYYAQAEKLLKEEQYAEASTAFARAQSYKDAAERIGEPYYIQAEKSLAAESFEDAAKYFSKAGDFRDAAERIGEVFYTEAEKLLKEEHYKEASAAFAEAGDYKDAKERVLEPYYAEAVKLLKEGKAKEADEAFAKAGDYRDAAQRIGEAYYALALRQMESGDYDAASDAFRAAGNFSDARQRILEPYYVQGTRLLEEKLYKEAAAAFQQASDIKDAQQQAEQAIIAWMDEMGGEGKAGEAAQTLLQDHPETAHTDIQAFADRLLKKDAPLQAAAALKADLAGEGSKEKLYQIAEILFADKQFAAAKDLFALLGDFRDSKKQLTEVCSAEAAALVEQGKYDEAIARYESIGDEASKQQAKEAAKRAADQLLAQGDFEAAIAAYDALGESEAVTDASYRYAAHLFNAKHYTEAAALFAKLKGHEDSEEKEKLSRYELAKEQLSKKQFVAAAGLFLQLKDYQDCAEQLLEARYRASAEQLEKNAFEKAIAGFSALENYKDSKEKALYAHYEYALALLRENKIKEALDELKKSGYDPGSHPEWIKTAYAAALKCLADGDFESAMKLFRMLLGYEDSNARLQEIAQHYIEKQNYEKALTALKDIHKEEGVPKLLCQIGKKYSESGDLLRAYPLYKASASYPESRKYLHSTVMKLKERAAKNYEDGRLEEQLALLKLLYEQGDLPKEELVGAEFIHFLTQVDHFNFGSFQNRTLYWHPLTFAHGRLLCIAADPVNTMPINGHDTPLINNWLSGFSSTFERRTERKHVVRTFLLRMNARQKYMGSEGSINVISYAQAKLKEDPEDFWTTSKTKSFHGYYIYDLEQREFVGNLENKNHLIHPALDLRFSEELMELLCGEGYAFYDVEGRELKFKPSV